MSEHIGREKCTHCLGTGAQQYRSGEWIFWVAPAEICLTCKGWGYLLNGKVRPKGRNKNEEMLIRVRK